MQRQGKQRERVDQLVVGHILTCRKVAARRSRERCTAVDWGAEEFQLLWMSFELATPTTWAQAFLPSARAFEPLRPDSLGRGGLLCRQDDDNHKDDPSYFSATIWAQIRLCSGCGAPSVVELCSQSSLWPLRRGTCCWGSYWTDLVNHRMLVVCRPRIGDWSLNSAHWVGQCVGTACEAECRAGSGAGVGRNGQTRQSWNMEHVVEGECFMGSLYEGMRAWHRGRH